MKKITALTLGVAIILSTLCACSSDNKEEETSSKKQEAQTSSVEVVEKVEAKINLDTEVKHQTIESFGASGAWWSQDVGGWSEVNGDGIVPRDEIAKLLFNKEEGIGLSAYRYNMGAGSAENTPFTGISDPWRRAISFESEAGQYDWTKDENAIWFVNKAVELGVEELVFFSNSPIERLTKSGHAFGTESEKSNLPEENYEAFSNYVLDVVEHFIDEGYPIKFVSPINEPQWDWISGQEGCHFEPEEVVAFLNVFLDKMEERNIEGLEISAPELGEWGNTSYAYYNAILSDERLMSRINSWDIHSYWSDTTAKNTFKEWLDKKGLSNLTLRTSEWCEMTNGKNANMESAINLAKEIYYDMTILDVSSWQYWIAVSCYDYRDGLIYVNKYTKKVMLTKRLWSMGNFSKFVGTGYQRVDCKSSKVPLKSVGYLGTDDTDRENLVVVLINETDDIYTINATDFGEWKTGDIYTTSEECSLEKTGSISTGNETIEIGQSSIITLTLYK